MLNTKFGSEVLERKRVPICERVRRLSVSPTIAMSTRAAELCAAGRDVISLAVGEPDFDTPRHIVEAADRAAREGYTRYTAADGGPEIKAAVAEKFYRENGLTFAPRQIHVASGAKQVIYNAFAATLEEGDEVIVFTPAWVSYIDVVEFCGGRGVVVPTYPENEYCPTSEQLREAITIRTRWVVINNPGNPTGAVWSKEKLEELLDVVRAAPDILVMSDEIYEHLIYDDAVHYCIAALAPDLWDRILVINGVSKTYAMTGWRIGYAAGPEWLTGAMAKVQSQTASSSNSPAQIAAAVALTSDQSLVEEWRQIMQRRRDLALSVLRSCERLNMIEPKGAFYIYIDVSACIGLYTTEGARISNDIELCEYMLDRADVACVPGAAFHMEPYFRLAFALDERRVAEACRRIVGVISELKEERHR